MRNMMPENTYAALSALREKYRREMNVAADKAQQFAQTEEMDRVSEFSTESERKREAFTALNQAIKIVEGAFSVARDPADTIPPAGYERLPDVLMCKCPKLWNDGKGNYWCCTPSSLTEKNK